MLSFGLIRCKTGNRSRQAAAGLQDVPHGICSRGQGSKELQGGRRIGPNPPELGRVRHQVMNRLSNRS